MRSSSILRDELPMPAPYSSCANGPTHGAVMQLFQFFTLGRRERGVIGPSWLQICDRNGESEAGGGTNFAAFDSIPVGRRRAVRTDLASKRRCQTIETRVVSCSGAALNIGGRTVWNLNHAGRLKFAASCHGSRRERVNVGDDVDHGRAIRCQRPRECRGKAAACSTRMPTAPMSSAMRAKLTLLKVHSSRAFGVCWPP